jgi:hypothetical protein
MIDMQEANERITKLVLFLEFREALNRLGAAMQEASQQAYNTWLTLDFEDKRRLARKFKRRELYLRRFRRRGMRMNKK